MTFPPKTSAKRNGREQRKRPRYLLWLLSILAGAVILLPLLAVLLLHFPPVQDALISRAMEEVRAETDIEVSLEGYRWWPFSQILLHDVSLRADGSRFLHTRRARLDYRLSWSSPYLVPRSLTVESADVQLRQNEEGEWLLPGTGKEQKNGEEPSTMPVIPLPAVHIRDSSVTVSDPGGTVASVAGLDADLYLEPSGRGGGLAVEARLEGLKALVEIPAVGAVSGAALATATSSEVTWEEARFVLPGDSRVVSEGRYAFAPEESLQTLLELDPLQWAKISVLKNAYGEVETVRGEIRARKEKGPGWTLSHDLTTNLGKLDGDATFFLSGPEAESADYRVAFEGLTLPIENVPDSELRGSADVKVRGFQPDELTADLVLKLERSRIGSEIVEKAEIEARYEEKTLKVGRLRAEGTPGSVEGGGTADLAGIMGQASRQKEPVPVSFDFEYRLDLPDLSKLPKMITGLKPMKGRAQSSGRLHGRLENTRWRGAVQLGKAAYGEYAVESLEAEGDASLGDFAPGSIAAKLAGKAEGLSIQGRNIRSVDFAADYDGGDVSFRKLDVKAHAGRLQVEGRAGFRPLFDKTEEAEGLPPVKLDLEYTATQFSIGEIAAVAKLESAPEGTLNSQGKIKGTVPDLGWEGEAEVDGFSYRDVKADKLKLRGRSELKAEQGKRMLALEAQGLKAGETRASSLSAEIDQDGQEARFSIHSELPAEKIILDAAGGISGVWRLPLDVALEKGTLRWKGRVFTLAGRASVEEKRLLVDKIEVTHREREKVSASGTVAWRGESDLEVEWSGLSLDRWVTEFADEVKLTGYAAGSARLQGPPEAPRFSLKTDLSGLQVEKEALEKVHLTANYAEGRVDFRARGRTSAGDEPLRLQGQLPVLFSLQPAEFRLVEDRPLQAELNAPGLRLSHFAHYFPSVEQLGGHVELTAQAGGTPKDPELTAEGNLSGGRVKLKDWPHPIEDIHLSLSADTGEVRIRNARAKSLGGSIVADGAMHHTGGELVSMDFKATAKRLRFPEFYGISGQASGNLHLRRESRQKPPRLTGQMDLRDVKMDLAAFESGLARNIEVVEGKRKGEVIEIEKEEKSPDFFDSMAMDVKLALPPSGTWVRGKGLEAEITGNLRIQKEPNGPVRLFGDISTIRGTYTVEAYKMRSVEVEIVEGTISFQGRPEPDPELDVRTRKKAGEVTVFVQVRGRLSEPELRFSSQPPMDQGQVLSYLLFGRPAGRLSSSENANLAKSAQMLLGSAGTEVLKGILGETEIAPDVLEFHGSSGEEGGGTIEIGKYLTPDLFMTFEKGIGEEGDQIRIEKRLSEHFSIETQIGREEQSGVDLMFEYDF